MARINKYILTDAGFWIGLFDSTDDHHEESIRIYHDIKDANIMIPWPIMYEVVCTRFVRNRIAVQRFQVSIKRPEVSFIEDSTYRQKALAEVLELSSHGKRQLSLADMIIRYILINKEIRIHGFVTFNKWDFLDACQARRVELLPSI